ncbi:methyl-accepting chemotaxis protein [Halomonas sp. WWR20]
MRNNQPVTEREYEISEHQFLISRTDAKGQITYASPAFIEASGFTREELIGAPHNIVRHPDMPSAAYANLWQTLKAGEVWTGLVKNRRKNGDYYWVHATVTPIVEADQIVGYTSVRIRADAKARAYAEQAYAAMAAGQRRGRMARGELKPSGVLGRLRGIKLGTLRSRLIGMISIGVVTLALSGGLSIYSLMQAGDRLHTLNRDGLEDVVRLQELDQLMAKGRQLVSGPVSNPMSDNMETVGQKVEKVLSELESTWTEYEAREINHTPTAEAFGKNLRHYIDDGLGAVMNSLSSGDFYQAYVAYNDVMIGENEAMSTALNSLIQAKRDNAMAMAAQAEQQERNMLMAQGGLLLLGLLLLLVLGVRTIRTTLRPIREALNVTLQIAAGNLGVQMSKHNDDEVGRLTRALDTMRRSLSNIIHDVNTGVGVVIPATQDIATGNVDLSARTEQQSASLTQTASSMEEMTATVKQNADNARQASQLAGGAADTVRNSGEVMGQVVQTMDRITQSSRKVGDIVGVIDSIAFQTNILALNASVEAARAGEQGRGFAVVADEVRNLASRSAQAAKEIRDLINASTKEVGSGAELVRQAEASIEQVVVSVKRVNDIMHEISAASEEQTSGIEQINQAITQMDDVTQQNAQLVQTSATTASELEAQVRFLAHSVAVFRLGGSEVEQHESAASPKALGGSRPALSSGSQPRPAANKPAAKQAAPAHDDWEAF